MKFRKLVFANLFRKKIRLILTIGSFAVAMLLFGFLAVIRMGFGIGMENVAGADRVMVLSRSGFIQLLPKAYQERMLRIPGVKAVTYQQWFGGVYKDERNNFAQFAIDPANQRKVYPELKLPDDKWETFLKDRRVAIVGAELAKRFVFK